MRWAILLGPAAVVFAIDQFSKAWVMANLAIGETITPIPGLADFFAITRSANRGAAFSFLPQAGDLFLIIALVMIAGILIFYRRMHTSRWIERLALGLLWRRHGQRWILGSARGRFHPFADPGHLECVRSADHAIVVGVCILRRQWLASRRRKEKAAAPAGQPGDQPPAAVVNESFRLQIGADRQTLTRNLLNREYPDVPSS
jgi:lipoprotein signal peptidase